MALPSLSQLTTIPTFAHLIGIARGTGRRLRGGTAKHRLKRGNLDDGAENLDNGNTGSRDGDADNLENGDDGAADHADFNGPDEDDADDIDEESGKGRRKKRARKRRAEDDEADDNRGNDGDREDEDDGKSLRSGYSRGRLAERERFTRIFAHKDSALNLPLAMRLACCTNMPAGAVLESVRCSPLEGASEASSAEIERSWDVAMKKAMGLPVRQEARSGSPEASWDAALRKAGVAPAN